MDLSRLSSCFFEVEASMERMELDRQELLKVMQESKGEVGGITGRHFQVGEIMVKCDSHRFVSWMIYEDLSEHGVFIVRFATS